PDAAAFPQAPPWPPRLGQRSARGRLGQAATGAPGPCPGVRAAQPGLRGSHGRPRGARSARPDRRATDRRLSRAQAPSPERLRAASRPREPRVRAADLPYPFPLHRGRAPPRRGRRDHHAPSRGFFRVSSARGRLAEQAPGSARSGGRSDGTGTASGRRPAGQPVRSRVCRRGRVPPSGAGADSLAHTGRPRGRHSRSGRCPRLRGREHAGPLPECADGHGRPGRPQGRAPGEPPGGGVREAGPAPHREVSVGGWGRRRHPQCALGAGRGGLARGRRRRREDRADAARLSVLESVLIANRGEIARRVIRACRALGVRSIAVYSEADAGWPHVTDADEAVLIGPAPARESYLDGQRILTAARERGAQAIHPGYGFLSENWRFAKACEEAGLVWIGPPWRVIQQMGDKVGARREMQRAGVPVVPGSEGPVGSVEEARRMAGEIGYPVMLKAAAGGGGIGMVKVADAAALEQSYAAAERRAQAAFGAPALFLERYLTQPRHVEVQIFGDGQGRIVHLHERECSIQRRHQKLIEESPAPNLTADLKERLTAAAVTGATSVGYVNAGTVEFIVQ